MGDLELNLEIALGFISQIAHCVVLKSSSLYKTKAWGVTDQPDFLNMAVEIDCGLQPEELLMALQAIEHQMGRVKTRKWGERLIDIDILLCEDKIVESERLTIPHPYLHQREFVLLPLSEIAPDFIHPVLGLSIEQIYKALQR